MTLEELAAATGLTANDLIGIWDAEASGSTEPTQKLTAQQLAAAVKGLANLIGTSDLDSVPTQGSTNAVKSGGVYNAIAQSTATGGSDYVKLPDGTMIQYGYASYNIATSIKTYSIQFSQQFVDIPVVTASTGAGGARVPVYTESVGKTGFELVFSAHSTTSTSWARWMAIGHWK